MYNKYQNAYKCTASTLVDKAPMQIEGNPETWPAGGNWRLRLVTTALKL